MSNGLKFFDLVHDAKIDEFIESWRNSSASESSNFQPFAIALCELLGVPKPDPSGSAEKDNQYVFEKRVPLPHEERGTTKGKIDLYRRGSFVMEAKQGSDGGENTPLFGKVAAPGRKGHGIRGGRTWQLSMQKAKNQAERYVRNLPAEEGRPPFIVVVDVGYSIELYSEFTRTGGSYVPYPDPKSYRILLEDLQNESVRDTLKQVWLDPLDLDPSKRSEKVTREIAARLASLAKTLEADGHAPDVVAGFLMRLIFTMFAEDVGLLPRDSFREFLEGIRGKTEYFPEYVEPLWQAMNKGGFSPLLGTLLARFNGGLFQDSTVLPIGEDALDLLIEAARADWREVEPAIFGTLLERALDPNERHKLGAHFTPRAYVERLVRPTLIEPLRSEWSDVQAAATQQLLAGNQKGAEAEIRKFHARLCGYRVLDPACGTGNFLYVSLEMMKRLEGEVIELLTQITGQEQSVLEMQGATVSPEQFLGLEMNPWAVKIAELVLWLGYLQWHFRTRGDVTLPEPILRDFKNVQYQDAVLTCKSAKLGEDGNLISCSNPEKTRWPDTDVIVGNPPFLWYSKMHDSYGTPYVEALHEAWIDVPKKSDLVMKWWHHAASLLREGQIERFGFITTNSIRQSSNGKIVAKHVNAKRDPISIVYAVPDHPWVDEDTNDASVRISMTVCGRGDQKGTFEIVAKEKELTDEINVDRVTLLKRVEGDINVDLTVGIDITKAEKLKANLKLSAVGFKTIGPRGTDGFTVPASKAVGLGLNSREGLEKHLKLFYNWDDLTSRNRNLMVFDFYNSDERYVRQNYPEAYQYLLDGVYEFRSQHSNERFRREWWVIGHPRQIFRDYTKGLERYIVTGETSKHRIFTFLPTTVAPESSLFTLGLDDAYFLGVLSSRIHVVWALASNDSLEDRPRYFKTQCFENFPFPEVSSKHREQIRDLAEELDSLRKRQLEEHPSLELTKLYNVVEKIRNQEELLPSDIDIRDKGLALVVARLHDDLDKAVAEAYGLSPTQSDDELLQHLLDLNRRRAAEEKQGLIRYLRPMYQNPDAKPLQRPVLEPELEVAPVAGKKEAWPKNIPEQVRRVRTLVSSSKKPLSFIEVKNAFFRTNGSRLAEVLETLTQLGQIVKLEDDLYTN